MITFLTIRHFRERLKTLLTIKRGVYAGCDQEIHSIFDGVTMTQILQNRDMILIEDEFVVVKLRVPDHRYKLSRKDGYRLIYMAMKQEEKVILLDIYPKRGPLQQLSISDDELLLLLDNYIQENEANILKEF